MDILPKKIRSRLLVWSIENLKIYSVDGDEALNRNCLDIVNFIATKLHGFIESNPSTNGQTSVKISANAGGALLDDLKQCLQHVIFLIKQHLRNVSHASCKSLDGMAALWSAYFDILFVKSQRFPVDETETTNGIGSCVYSLNGSVDHVMDVFLQCEYSDVPTAYEIIAMFIGKLRDMLKSDKDKALKMGSFVRGVLVYHQAGRVIGCGRKVEKSLKKILLKRCHSPWETLNLIQAHSGGLLSMDDIPNDAEKSRLNILFDHSTMTKEKCDCLLEAVAGLTSIVTDQSISPESVDVIETIDIENEESENTTIPGIYALTDKNMEMEVELAETESCETDGQPIAEDTSDSVSIPTFVSFEPQSTKSPGKSATATESAESPKKAANATESAESPKKAANATESAESPKKAANATESTKSPKKLGNSIESFNSTSTGQMETVQSETNGPDDSASQQSSSLNDIIVDEVQFTEVCPAWRRLRSNSNINEKSKLDSPGKTKRGECRSPSASPSNKFKIFDTDSSQSDSSPERRSQKKQDSSIDQSANSTKNRKSVWPEKSQSQPIPMGDQQEGHRLRSRSISTSQPHQPVENRPVIVCSRELDIPTCPLPNGMENEMSNEDTINSNLISLARQTRRKLYFADKSIVKSCASLSPCFTHRSKRHEEIIDGGKPSQLENMPEDLSSQEVDTIVTRGKQQQVQVDRLNLSPMIIMSPFSPPRRSHSDRKKVTGKSPNGPTPKRTQLTQKTLSPWKKSTEKSTLLDVLKLSRKESAENVKNSGTKSKPGRNQSTTKSKSSGEGSTTKLRSTDKDFPPKSPSPNKDFRSKSKSPGKESPSKSRPASKQSPTKSKPVGDESEPKSPSTQTGLGSKSPGKELSENGNLPPRPNGSPRRKSKLSPITPTPAKRRRVGADKIIAARAQVDSTIMTPRYNMRTRAQSVNGKND